MEQIMDWVRLALGGGIGLVIAGAIWLHVRKLNRER